MAKKCKDCRWDALVKRVDWMSSTAEGRVFIPIGSELSKYLHMCRNYLQKFYNELTDVSDKVIKILVRGLQVQGVFSWIADNISLPIASVTEGEVLREKLKEYIKICIDIADGFFDIAEGRTELPENLNQLLLPLITALNHPLVVAETNMQIPPIPESLIKQTSTTSSDQSTRSKTPDVVQIVRDAKQIAEEAKQTIILNKINQRKSDLNEEEKKAKLDAILKKQSAAMEKKAESMAKKAEESAAKKLIQKQEKEATKKLQQEKEEAERIAKKAAETAAEKLKKKEEKAAANKTKNDL